MKTAAIVLVGYIGLCVLFVLLYATHTVILFARPVDFATIVLTASAVLLAILGAGIAALTVFGYENIKKAAVKASVRAATARAGKVAKEVAEPVASRTALEAIDKLREAPTTIDAEQIANTSGLP